MRADRTRRGVAAVLAMLFLSLFVVLALGFYASVTTAVQITGNHRSQAQSRLASESGMAFVRHHLANLNVPPNADPNSMFATVASQLATRLNGTTNMAGSTVSVSGDNILIPSANGWIESDASGGRFRGTISKLQNGQQLRVKVIGNVNGIDASNGTQLDYAIAQEAASIFNFGVASNGPITMTGNARIAGYQDPTKGSVLSTYMGSNTPVTSTGNCTISGDVSFVNPNANVSYSGNISIGGSSNPVVWATHVHKGVAAPEFPTVDTSIFAPYATTNITTGSTNATLNNVRIKANANPTFSGNAAINGVMYIETPNNVRFSGNVTIKGVIVVQNNPTGDVNSNQLTFSGNVNAQGPQALPASYGDLRNLTGSFLLAPNFALNMSGNFGTVGGSIIAGKMTFSGNAGGTINGSVINMTTSPVTISGNSTITINSQGTSDYPAGVYFGSHFTPLPFTYAEVSE